MKEWFLSSELVEVDGFPNTVGNVSGKARRNNWISRKAVGNGRAMEYHISSFHPDLKKKLIEKYVKDPNDAETLMNLEAPTEGVAPEQSNVSKIVPLAEVRDWCELPVFDVHAAAGAGSLVHSEYQIDKLIIPKSLLAEFGLAPNCAAIIYVDGNSMEPTLSHKDRLLVDTRELQHPVTDGVYVIRIDDAVYVKRLKWNIPKGIYQVISDNPTYESFEINHKNGRNFKIIGKAIAPVFKKIF
ncbi:peptidase [Vibrio fluvialis]|nr:peptidase [Vibrio fluvialis]ELO1774505.1 peptidase [Vibrio fluvialis]MBY7946678.1 peptidase [Vibrio fluvialis]